MSEDPYTVLGISRTATPSEIKERFRFLSHAYHPDKFATEAQRRTAENEFKRIGAAYQLLANTRQQRTTTPASQTASAQTDSPQTPSFTRPSRASKPFRIHVIIWSAILAAVLIDILHLSSPQGVSSFVGFFLALTSACIAKLQIRDGDICVSARLARTHRWFQLALWCGIVIALTIAYLLPIELRYRPGVLAVVLFCMSALSGATWLFLTRVRNGMS
jgi:hypothetical protein